MPKISSDTDVVAPMPVQVNGTMPGAVSRLKFSPMRIFLFYLLIGFLWIFIGDSILYLRGKDSLESYLWDLGKGLLYVLLTGLVLYSLISRAFRELMQSLDLLRAVLNGITDAVFIKDREGRYILANHATARFVGRSVPDIIGRTDAELFDAASAAVIRNQDQKVMQSGEVHVEEEVLTTGGQTRTFMAMKGPYRNNLGEIIGTVGSSRDISSRVKATNALRTSEERLQIALSAAGAIAFVWDIPRNEVVRYFSKEESLPANLKNPEPFEVVQKAIYSEDLKKFTHAIQTSLNSTSNDYRNLYRVQRKNGEIRWLEEWGTFSRDDNGKPLKLTGISIDVTERILGQEKLQESERNFRELANAIPQIVWITNERGELLQINNQAVNYSGLELTSIQGWSWDRVIHPEDYPVVYDHWQSILQQRTEPKALQFRIRRADGTFRWHIARSVAVKDKAGQINKWFGTCTDIHDQKTTEEILLGQNRILNLIADNQSLDAVLTTSITTLQELFPNCIGSVLLLNPETRTFDRGVAPSLPREYMNAVSTLPIGPNVGSCGTAAYFAKQVIVEDIENDPLWEDYKALALKHDLKACWSVPILASHSEPSSALPPRVLGTFAVYQRTVGPPPPAAMAAIDRFVNLARIAIERHENLATLRESEQRLRSILDNSPLILFMRDLDGKYLFVNRRCAEVSGIPAEKWVGKLASELLPTEICQKFDANIAQVMEELQPIEFEEQSTLPNGDNFTALTMLFPLFRTDGTPYAICGIANDITARKKLEAQLRQSQRMEAVGQLAGGIAHDFNNLLTVINGYSELLLMDDSLASNTRNSISAIHEAGQRASTLTAQLLAFSRKTIVEPKVLDINKLVENLARMLTRLIGEDVQFKTFFEPNIDRVRIDPGQIEQVLINLVVNARDAMPQGGTLTIQTLAQDWSRLQLPPDAELEPGRYVLLKVSDTGSGIRPEVLAKVFEPFFTTKEPGKGTGLGLATVYGIIRQAGGHIAVESLPGHGTCFTIWMRATKSEFDQPIDVSNMEVSCGTERILLAEDEDAVRQLCREVLTRQGYRVHVTANAKQALEYLETSTDQVDLLITDVVMPNMSGRELADLLRQRYPRLKVLFMTGYTDDAIIRHGVEVASDSLIAKPFTPQQLGRKVRQLLDQ